MTAGKRNDPYANFRFFVEIEGLIVAGFSEVTGLTVEVETEEYREGGVNSFVHKLPKVAKYSNITLRRGLTDSDCLWNWQKDIIEGKISRKSGSIVLKDQAGNEKWRWNFMDAYPAKWTGPDFKASENAVAVESLELVHKGLKKG